VSEKEPPLPAEQSPSLRPLGKTNIQVIPIGLGMMEFAGQPNDYNFYYEIF
jgi:aryl-alcohol dehydrogenase-like predicted oxidoreductase